MSKLLKKYLIVCIMMLTLGSCSTMEFSGIYDEDALNIVGSVTDKDGLPIEHIKVTIDWEQGKHQRIKYTSSTGRFEAQVGDLSQTGIINLTITLEDIDGENNNGLFQSYTENLTLILSEMEDKAINLEYRLTHAS